MIIFRRFLFACFIVLFFTGITVSIIGRALCTSDNENYTELQSELHAPDVIDTVLYDKELRRIYVCYNDASYVNVYSEGGRFLWAVSTPYLRSVYFALTDNQLIIYNGADAYVYNSSNGAFIEKKSSDDLELSYDWENEYAEEIQIGALYFDTYQVYRAQENGKMTAIVERPWWHWLFNFGVCWCVSLCGAVGVGALILIEKRKEWKSVRNGNNISNDTFVSENKKFGFAMKYFKITSAVHIIYAVLNVVFGIFFNGILCIGILPLAIHFIASSIIFSNRINCIRLTESEQKIKDYWTVFEIGSFIVAFASAIVIASIT